MPWCRTISILVCLFSSHQKGAQTGILISVWQHLGLQAKYVKWDRLDFDSKLQSVTSATSPRYTRVKSEYLAPVAYNLHASKADWKKKVKDWRYMANNDPFCAKEMARCWKVSNDFGASCICIPCDLHFTQLIQPLKKLEYFQSNILPSSTHTLDSQHYGLLKSLIT